MFVVQSCGHGQGWIRFKPRQKASQEQVKEKGRKAERRSGQTTVMLMKGDFRAMTSLFLSSRGHVLPHTKSNAVKITGTKYKQMP